MKLYLIAGEASGDLHGSNLVKALLNERSDLHLRGWGGDLMEQQGLKLIKHYRELAFMGFTEVLMNLRTILRNIRFCKEDISAYRPDAVILIDYPGFNLRIAKWCRTKGIPVFYYISPQIWAWKANRVYQIKRDVTQMFTILPFEKDFYRRYGMEVEYVGHPLLDVIEPQMPEQPAVGDHPAGRQKLVAILPGSRKQEIQRMLPVMLNAVRRFNNCQYVIAGAPGQDASFYHRVAKSDDLPLVFGQTYALFKRADAALITSGTATLEAALSGLPLVVCYKGGTLSYQIAKRVIKVKFISLVNLILNREAVPELIQDEFNVTTLTEWLDRLLSDGAYRLTQQRDFDELHKRLGGRGASTRAAKAMLKTLQSQEQTHTEAR